MIFNDFYAVLSDDGKVSDGALPSCRTSFATAPASSPQYRHVLVRLVA